MSHFLSDDRPSFGRCPCCDSIMLCAADCPLGPWNFDKPRTTPFLYLLRQRRWAKSPVDSRWIFFCTMDVPFYNYFRLKRW